MRARQHLHRVALCFIFSVVWLVGWMVVWWFGGLVGWLLGWLVSQLVGFFLKVCFGSIAFDTINGPREALKLVSKRVFPHHTSF